MEYAIIHMEGKDCLGRLERAVESRIASGWRPQGGVCFVDRPTFVSASQAMVRDLSAKGTGEKTDEL